jgi:hypothetical protein
MTTMKTRKLSFGHAMDEMRRPEARLVEMYGRGGGSYVTPSGGEVTATVAEAIKNHPLVRAGYDALFPGMSQTWRMLDDRASSTTTSIELD